jgi:hypothetical protein
MTLTIEKPETEQRLLAYASARGISPVEALDVALEALASLLDDPETDRHLTPAELEALGRSIADADAGRVISGEALFAELRTA